MTEDPSAVKTRERLPPTAEELASANEVVLAMVKAAKGLRIYLSNNPTLIKYLDELNSKMSRHIARFGEVRIDVEPFVLTYKGAVVYDNRDPKDSLAFRIHADGIRVLLFTPGLELRELKVFLGVIALEELNQRDDDIVTELWQRDLPHIKYIVEEDLLEMADDVEEAEPRPQQEAISKVLAYLSPTASPPLRSIPRHLLMLTRDDVEWLRKVRQAEVNRKPLEDVFNILFAILAGVKEPEIFGDFLDIAANMIAGMFKAADISRALMLVRFLDHLRGQQGISPEQRRLIDTTMTGVLADGAVQALQEAIDASEAVGYDEVRRLLLTLGLPSLGAICELLGRVEKLKMRKVIVEVLVELGRERPEVFAPFLSDPRWYLVRNVVLVLSLIGTKTALRMIVGLISHREQRIRREVLTFLDRSADPKAKPYIVRYLRDDSSALRIRALQILARERLPFALKPILALTTADDFKSRDLAEKKAVYEAIGELGSDEVLPLFSEMLLKKRWFQKAPTKESVTCAVAGLMKIRSQGALELLEEARSNRNPEIREMIREAIAAVTAASEESYEGGT